MAIDVVPGDARESRCVQGLFEFMLTCEIPPRVIGDKACDSDKLDHEPAERGVEMIAPHRGNRLPEKVTGVDDRLSRVTAATHSALGDPAPASRYIRSSASIPSSRRPSRSVRAVRPHSRMRLSRVAWSSA